METELVSSIETALIYVRAAYIHFLPTICLGDDNLQGMQQFQKLNPLI
jgi:hypothetical protein